MGIATLLVIGYTPCEMRLDVWVWALAAAVMLIVHPLRSEPLGSVLPELRATALDGRPLLLPDSAFGCVTLVGFAFKRELQDDLTAWLREFEPRQDESDAFRAYEIPMMGNRIPRPIRSIANQGMRRAIPPHLRGRVAPYYGDTDRYAAALEIDDRSVVHVFLLDADGVVRWRTTGPPGPESVAELADAIAALQEEP